MPADAALHYAVLGPLRAWRGDLALALGPVQQRVALAVLLMNANRPVSLEQMIRGIWGDASPSRAVNLVQRHVSGLRRVIEPERSPRSASGVLTWTEAGYLLSVAPGALDLQVYEGILTRAAAARAAGDLPDAAALLQVALDAW